MKVNETWHKKHVLGAGAPLAKRIDWHLRHERNCGCREIPQSIARVIEKKKVKTCSRRHKFIGPGPCPICWPGSLENEK